MRQLCIHRHNQLLARTWNATWAFLSPMRPSACQPRVGFVDQKHGRHGSPVTWFVRVHNFRMVCASAHVEHRCMPHDNTLTLARSLALGCFCVLPLCTSGLAGPTPAQLLLLRLFRASALPWPASAACTPQLLLGSLSPAWHPTCNLHRCSSGSQACSAAPSCKQHQQSISAQHRPSENNLQR